MLLDISIPCGWMDPSELWTLLYYVDCMYTLALVVVGWEVYPLVAFPWDAFARNVCYL
jgi:hypothetical protein